MASHRMGGSHSKAVWADLVFTAVSGAPIPPAERADHSVFLYTAGTVRKGMFLTYVGLTEKHMV